MEKRKFSWKEALLLVLVLAVAAGVYLYAKTRPKGAEAVIEQDGEVYRRVVLADLKEPLTLEVNGAVIELDKDGAHFVSSPCPDKICVNKGSYQACGRICRVPAAARECAHRGRRQRDRLRNGIKEYDHRKRDAPKGTPLFLKG